MKVLHLLSDEKFITSHQKKFDSNIFDNTYVLIVKDKERYKKKKNNVVIVEFRSEFFYNLVKQGEGYDLVVSNGLSYEQAYFINKLHCDFTNIIWSFFGAEIYGDPFFFDKKFILDSTNYSLWKKNRIYRFLQYVYHYRFYFISGNSMNKEIRKAIKRCKFFLWYSVEEYDFIVKKGKNLIPDFIQLPFLNLNFDINESYEKSDSIIIGNSGSEYNNHLAILESISKCTSCRGEYNYIIPFSYGYNLWYKKEMILKSDFLIKNEDMKINLMKEFLDYKDYMSCFKSCSTAVYPSFRQMGLGNIILCLQFGVKVYLSEKNPIHSWLVNNDFYVYSIEKDFFSDFQEKKLILDDNQALINKKLLFTLRDKFNLNDFHNKIVRLNKF